MPCLLGVFAKFWQPGKVKTRLAGDMGAEGAAQLYHGMLTTLLDRLAALPTDRMLAYWPPERQREFAELAGERGFNLQCQADGGLGERMRAYFQTAFSAGYRKVLLIGSDAPTIPQAHFEAALELLDQKPVVLGPSKDGGYYLVGAANEAPPIFEGVDWSTSRVWDQTLARLKTAECPFGELPPWYDVDDLGTLEQLRHELEGLTGIEFDPLRDAISRAWSRQDG